MNKLLRFLSTLTVIIGLLLLFVYLNFENSVDKMQLLTQPSYSTLQSYGYLLLAAAASLIVSLLGSFLSWNKKLDPVKEAIPNAVAADKAELLGWLHGTTLDTRKDGATVAEDAVKTQKTVQKGGTVLVKASEATVPPVEETEPQTVLTAETQTQAGNTVMTEEDTEATVYESISDFENRIRNILNDTDATVYEGGEEK